MHAHILHTALVFARRTHFHHSLVIFRTVALALAPVVALDAPALLQGHARRRDGDRVPNTLEIPSLVAPPHFTLVGLGVSFLGI